MIAYILVIPTPWLGVTGADGDAQLRGLPAGACDLEVWQPQLKNSADRLRQRSWRGGESPYSKWT